MNTFEHQQQCVCVCASRACIQSMCRESTCRRDREGNAWLMRTSSLPSTLKSWLSIASVVQPRDPVCTAKGSIQVEIQGSVVVLGAAQSRVIDSRKKTLNHGREPSAAQAKKALPENEAKSSPQAGFLTSVASKWHVEMCVWGVNSRQQKII